MESKLTTARPDDSPKLRGRGQLLSTFLRDLQGEVLEMLRLARELRDSRTDSDSRSASLSLNFQTPEKLYLISNSSYSVALNAAHR
jgi:hypothetical protein